MSSGSKASLKASIISTHASASKHKGSAKRARVETSAIGASKSSAAAKPKSPPVAQPAVSFAAPSSASVSASPIKKKARLSSPATSSSRSQKLKPSTTESTAAAPAPASTTSSTLPRGFIVIVGTYEKLLYGLEGVISEASSPPASSSDPPKQASATRTTIATLKPVFIFPAHVASVRTVAASGDGGKWLATGGTDETIKVWDLRRRKEVGGLMQHHGSITHLEFLSRTHLISASEDGTIALFHTRDWQVLVTLKGHKGRVNSVAVHPTGKLALSVGRDRALRMWDLMRGKPSASTLLGKEGELVRWSGDGKKFVVQSGNGVDVYQTDMSILQSIVHPSRIHDVGFARHPLAMKGGSEVIDNNELLLVAAEDKKISVYATFAVARSQEGDGEGAGASEPPLEYRIVAELIGHVNRVKAFDIQRIQLPGHTPPSISSTSRTPSTTTILASASSDGCIHVYDLSALPLPSSTTSSLSLSSSTSLAAPAVVGAKIPPVPTLISASQQQPNNNDESVFQLHPMGTYDTKGSRLTCLTLAGSDGADGGGGEGPGTGHAVRAGDKRRRGEDE